MTREQIEEATEAAARYQRGFCYGDLREAKLGRPFGDTLGRLVFRVNEHVSIFADVEQRRLWTDFVSGAGVSY